ncbi:MAG: tetratricopeptide repeat protein [Planctomycetales bacterium]|nr:tetratricopeptide repeat protein [bacterium]UNM06915.1 MAG: tetratricopeptide repeat protein [Planctomycetales bacterium]
MKIQNIPALLCLLLALFCSQAFAQDSGIMQQEKQVEPPTLAQRVQYMLIARELPWITPDSDMQVFSASSLDALGELREAMLLSRLQRNSDPGKRRAYFEKQFMPYLERQDQALRDSGEVRFLQAIALLELGRLDEALAIAQTLPAESSEDGSGYALWGIVLMEQGNTAEAGKVLEAGRKFYRENGLLLLEWSWYSLAAEQVTADQFVDFMRPISDFLLANGPAAPYLQHAMERGMAGYVLARGNADVAMGYAESVLKAYPGDIEMLSVAARAAAERRQFNLAAEYQQELCSAEPSPANWLALAGYKSELNDDTALAAYNEALRLAPADAAILQARSAWHEKHGNREAAVADLRSVLDADPDNRDAARALARLLAGSDPGPQGEGEEQLRNVIRTDPSPAAYLDLLEVVGSDPKRRAEYENIYNDMLARFRNTPAVVLFHAQRLLSEEKYTQALEQFRIGEGLDPTMAGFPLGIGDSLRAMGGFSEAVEAYRRALRLGYSPQAVAGLARSLDMAGEGAEAERVFRDAANEHPRDAALVMQYGLFLFERTQYTAAMEQYELGRTLEPDNEMFVNRHALCLFQLNQIPEAISMLKQAIAIHPRPLFYRNLAIAYEEDAETELAERSYQDGLELFPGDQQLLEGYSEFLEQQGRGGEALDILARSAQSSDDIDVLMDLATLAQSAGRNELARQSYERAVGLDPFDLVVNERYMTFLAMQRDNQAMLDHMLEAGRLLREEDYEELVGSLTGFFVEQRLAADGELLLSRLIETQPTVVRLYNSLALMQHLDGDNETALTTVTRGQRYAGESFLGLYLQTLISWRSLGTDSAIPLGARLIENPQADAKAWLLYLDLLASAKQTEEEASVATRGLKQFFGNVDIYRHLVRATRQLGDIRELIRVLEDPQYVRIRLEERPLLLGRSYIAVGNYPRALAALQPLLEENPFDEEALRLSGEANFMLGEQAMAREQLTSALAINPELYSASIWLGWVLLTDRDLAGAEQSFSSAEKSPSIDQLELAWTRLGQATVAIRRGERMEAQGLLKQAEALGGGDERFDSYVPRIRDEIRPQ